MKKKAVSIVLALSMTLGLCACGGGQGKEAASDAGGEDKAAQTESVSTQSAETEASAPASSDVSGKLVIYTSMYEDIIDEMDKALGEKFPNLDVEFFQGGTGTIQSKVAAEMDSGKLGCDLLMVAEPSYSLELKDQGVLHPYDYGEKDKLMFEYDPEGYWYPVRTLNMVLAYNPEKYEKSQVPNTMEDFAKNTSMKGLLSMSNPLTSGTAYASVVGLLDKYGEDYFTALGSQDVAIESGSVALTKLETGECAEIMILEESVLKKREEEGSSLEVIYPEDGSIPVPSTIMIIDESHSANANIKAAEAVEDYFLSPEGQEQIVKGWMYSVRSDVDSYPYDAVPTAKMMENTIPVDWQKCYKEREQIRTMFQEHVTVPQ